MNVFAIIVTYQSDVDRLRQILAILRPQCPAVIVDNSLNDEKRNAIAACAVDDRVHYVSMQGNQGIGAAQNRGIVLARSLSADTILLLDDDSIPANDLVPALVACADRLGDHAIVGANALDHAGREISNARHAPGAIVACRDMMSSGSLIRCPILDRVGPFDETLFVDGVDFDWGWRAARMGYTLHLCRATAIRHQLGEGKIAGVGYPSPIRHYFQYRNILSLMRRSYVPWGWRVSQMLKLHTKLLLIPLLMPEKGRRLRFAFAGIRDAILGRVGPWQASGASHAR